MILYEVDFTKQVEKVKNEPDDKKKKEPAKKIQIVNDAPHYISKACDYYNSGLIIQALDCMNLAQQIDQEQAFSSFRDCSLIGLIQLKLSNFNLAKKNFLKAFYLGAPLSIFPILLQNCALNKDFALSERIRSTFNQIIPVSPLSVVKNTNRPIYDEHFKVKNLFADFLHLYNHSSHGFDDRLYYTLKIVDSTNPYVVQLEMDKNAGALRKAYPANFTSSLYEDRLNIFKSELKKKRTDFSRINQKGLIRFLAECTSVEDFCYYIQELFKKTNLPKNIIWQCEDYLFEDYNCKAKAVLFENLANICKQYDKKDLGLLYKDCLINILDVNYVSVMQAVNKKVSHAFHLALFDFINLLIKDKNEFNFEVQLDPILQNFLDVLLKNSVNFKKISAEKLKKIFYIALCNNHAKQLNKENKDFEEENISLIKKLGLDYSYLTRIITAAKSANLIFLNR